MKNDKKIINEVEKRSKNFFNHKNDGCHDWSHVERVRKIALHIGRVENANALVLEIAALMHDIGRDDEVRSRGKICHAKAGANIAGKILAEIGLEDNTIVKILHCISSHRNRSTEVPKSLEARIIFDADKLDSIGAVGIGRVFMFAGITSGLLCTGKEKMLAKREENLSFTREDTAPLEYELKLKYIKDRMLTMEGRRMAKERHVFMKEFFERFWREVNGNI